MEHPTPQPEVDFESAYRSLPPWEIGKPQPALVELALEGSVAGPVLDVGCGTGENALELARHGLEVVAIDSSPAAIEQARAKAAARSLDVDFLVADAYDLTPLARSFPTVIDSALLHVIPERDRYERQLATIIEPGGRLILLEISDQADIPYPKISEAEIRSTFPSPRWRVESLGPSTYDTHLGQFPAWLGVVIAAH